MLYTNNYSKSKTRGKGKNVPFPNLDDVHKFRDRFEFLICFFCFFLETKHVYIYLHIASCYHNNNFMLP